VDVHGSPSSQSANQFAANIAKALKGETVHDEQLMDYSMMKEMRWTWQELIDTPLHIILSISFINGRVKVFENLQKLKGEKGPKYT
jgi:hypothetical protein